MKLQPPPVSRNSATTFRTPQPERLVATLELLGFERYSAGKNDVAAVFDPDGGYGIIARSGVIDLSLETSLLAAALRAMTGEIALNDLRRFIVRPEQEPYHGFWTNRTYILWRLLRSAEHPWSEPKWPIGNGVIGWLCMERPGSSSIIKLTYDGRALPGGDDPAPAIQALQQLVIATGGEVL